MGNPGPAVTGSHRVSSEGNWEAETTKIVLMPGEELPKKNKKSLGHCRRQTGDLRSAVVLYSLPSVKYLILMLNSLIMENNIASG